MLLLISISCCFLPSTNSGRHVTLVLFPNSAESVKRCTHTSTICSSSELLFLSISLNLALSRSRGFSSLPVQSLCSSCQARSPCFRRPTNLVRREIAVAMKSRGRWDASDSFVAAWCFQLTQSLLNVSLLDDTQPTGDGVYLLLEGRCGILLTLKGILLNGSLLLPSLWRHVTSQQLRAPLTSARRNRKVAHSSR